MAELFSSAGVLFHTLLPQQCTRSCQHLFLFIFIAILAGVKWYLIVVLIGWNRFLIKSHI
jgi:hypothetical protein